MKTEMISVLAIEAVFQLQSHKLYTIWMQEFFSINFTSAIYLYFSIHDKSYLDCWQMFY